jgi:hypothetical protein
MFFVYILIMKIKKINYEKTNIKINYENKKNKPKKELISLYIKFQVPSFCYYKYTYNNNRKSTRRAYLSWFSLNLLHNKNSLINT